MSFSKKIKEITSSEFFKNSATLLSANVISQIIGLAAYPFITRIYGPEIFGEYALFMSIVTILSIFSTGKYEAAIMLPKTNKEISSLFYLSFVLNVCITILFSFLFLALKDEIASVFGINELKNYLLLIPLFILLNGSWQTLNFYYVRKKKYFIINTYNIVQSAISNGLKLFLGVKDFIIGGLITGQLVGQISAIISNLIAGKKILKTLENVDRKHIIKVAKKYANFPKFELPHQLLNIMASNMPVLLLSFFFENEKIGLFSFALTIGSVPVFLFAKSIHQTLFRKVSEQVRNGKKIKKNISTFCKFCVVTLLPFFLLFVFISEFVFGSLFGTEWADSGLYFKLLLPWLFMIVLTNPLSFIPDIFFKQKIVVKLEIVFVFFRLSSIVITAYFSNFAETIAVYSLISTLILIIKLIWYYRIINEYEVYL